MKKLFMAAVRGYQKFISPLFPPSCRYHPTCSHYTLEALEKHGALKGTLMGAGRIIRCNPFVEGGLDPVPDHFTLRRQYPSVHPTTSLTPEEVRQNDLEQLLDAYEPELIIQELDLDKFLSQHFNFKKVPLSVLTSDYLKQQEDYLRNLGLKDIDLILYQVDHEHADLDLPTPPYESALNQAVADTNHLYLLAEKSIGVFQTSDLGFAMELIIAFGVGRSDIESRTPRLYHYLISLDQI